MPNIHLTGDESPGDAQLFINLLLTWVNRAAHLAKGYEVRGIKRCATRFNTLRGDHIYENPQIDSQRLELSYGELINWSDARRILQHVQPKAHFNVSPVPREAGK